MEIRSTAEDNNTPAIQATTGLQRLTAAHIASVSPYDNKF